MKKFLLTSITFHAFIISILVVFSFKNYSADKINVYLTKESSYKDRFFLDPAVKPRDDEEKLDPRLRGDDRGRLDPRFRGDDEGARGDDDVSPSLRGLRLRGVYDEAGSRTKQSSKTVKKQSRLLRPAKNAGLAMTKREIASPGKKRRARNDKERLDPRLRGDDKGVRGNDKGIRVDDGEQIISILHNLIQNQIRYPVNSSFHHQRRIYLYFVLFPNGHIESERILQSSGIALLDQAALDGVASISKTKIAKDLVTKPREFRVPIEFLNRL